MARCGAFMADCSCCDWGSGGGTWVGVMEAERMRGSSVAEDGASGVTTLLLRSPRSVASTASERAAPEVDTTAIEPIEAALVAPNPIPPTEVEMAFIDAPAAPHAECGAGMGTVLEEEEDRKCGMYGAMKPPIALAAACSIEEGTPLD